MILHALRATPFVYCVQDLYPDIAVHLGVLRANGAAARLTGTAANACYRAAHTLVALSEGMADQLIAKGVPADRIHVIPNWADTSDVSPQPRDNPLARTLGCDTGFVIQYSGNLGLSQGLESVLEAAEMVQDLPIRFMLVGDGNARAALQASASSKQLTNVSFYPAQPRERLPDLLSACDIGLVTMKRGVGNDLVPSKLYGIMAAGRPVLAAVEATSEVARVVRVHECGWTAEPESPRELASTIRIAFASSKNERQKIGERGRQTCVANYSRKSSTARYGKLITAIVDQAPREAAGANPKASNTPWAEL
jgi:colanic acid biosynthesis glycosyl transferase WcaI